MRRAAVTRTRVVAAVALAALIATGTPATASTAPPGPSPDPGPSAPAGPGVTPGPLPSGSPDPRVAAAVTAWVDASGETDLEALAEDFTALEQAAAAGRLPDMATACELLGTDVEAAQRHPPIPDAPAQQAWAATLTLYDLGARDCVTGALRADPTVLGRASDEIVGGSQQLQRMTERLTAIR